MSTLCSYYLVEDNLNKVIVIIDNNYDDKMSVTNDINSVINEISQNYDLNKYELIYQDSEGIYDGIVTNNNKFSHFYSINTEIMQKAVEVATIVRARMALRYLFKT